MPIPILKLPSEVAAVEKLLGQLRLDARQLALLHGPLAEADAAVRRIMADVAERGDAAVADSARQFDDPAFTTTDIRVKPGEIQAAVERVPAQQLAAIRRSIDQVREYQSHILPDEHAPLNRPGVELGIRFTPLDSAGLYFPGGKASYPSSLIMLAVPALVAGVGRIVVCTPPSRFGRSDLVLAVCHELKLADVYRAGGAAAIAAMAFGTETIPAVDKIVGPGNAYVQLAKRALSGTVGVDGYLGPSEILTIADDSGNPSFIAADMIAQAEHDPGSCFLLTTSRALADAVASALAAQLQDRARREPIEQALCQRSAIIVDGEMNHLIEWANRFAAEHVNLQTRDDATVLRKLRHAGAVFMGPFSPVAAGDYIAGPSHCLPTNTTARFTSGVSVYTFLKSMSIERYTAQGLQNDAPHIIALAEAEQLDGHAASVRVRQGD